MRLVLSPSCSTGNTHKYEWTLPAQSFDTRGCGQPNTQSITLSNGTHTATLSVWGIDGTKKSITKTFSTSNGDKLNSILDTKRTTSAPDHQALACSPSNRLPVALFSATVQPPVGAKLNGALSTSTSEILTYEWTSPTWGSQKIMTCFSDVEVSFLNGGTHNVSLKVTNVDGFTSKVTTRSVTVPGTGDR